MCETIITEIVNLCDSDTGNDINRNKEHEKTRLWGENKLNFGHFEFLLANIAEDICLGFIHIEIVKAMSVKVRVSMEIHKCEYNNIYSKLLLPILNYIYFTHSVYI